MTDNIDKNIFVCKSCDLDKPVPPERSTAGASLAATIKDAIVLNEGGGWSVREVGCLNGCLKPCNVSFRGPNRFTVRFSRVTAADVMPLLTFGTTYWHSEDGATDIAQIPESLRDKLTVYTPPRGSWT